jgi:HSP20 family protein
MAVRHCRSLRSPRLLLSVSRKPIQSGVADEAGVHTIQIVQEPAEYIAKPRDNLWETVQPAAAADISGTDTEYPVKAEIPGVDRKDDEVTVQDVACSLSTASAGTKRKRFHRVEPAYGSFMQTSDIPDVIDEAKVKAEFKEGILFVHLRKTEKAKSKAIEVKAIEVRAE